MILKKKSCLYFPMMLWLTNFENDDSVERTLKNNVGGWGGRKAQKVGDICTLTAVSC